MPNATDIRNAAAHIEANDGQPGEIEWLRHWLREGADLIGQLYAIMEDPHAVQWNMKTGQIATPTNWGWFTDEDNTLRAELKRLREELMQQNELRRMEAEALAAKGAQFLDAPVFGSKNEAANGGLWIVVGGDRALYERMKPILEVLSETTHYMGVNAMGTSMKLVGNLVVAFQLEALGEAMVLATKAGLNAQDVLGVLHVTDFKSPIFDGVGNALINRDFETFFALKLMLKDANLISRFAQDVNSPTPALAVIREMIKGGVNRGWGDENASAFIKNLEEQAGVQVKA